jgi:hypothetical protein
MARRNRVTPFSELVADPARGLVYGNRGCLHDDRGEIRRRYAGKRWIACRLEFKGWRRDPIMPPGGYTDLFFLDEATAFAAGHRPCALCRRDDYRRFTERWWTMHPGERGVDAIDARLHAERLDPSTRTQRRHDASLPDLPDGAFVVGEDGDAWLVHADELLRWTPSGYATRTRRPAGRAILLTPPSLVEVLRPGWEPLVPFLHPSAA